MCSPGQGQAWPSREQACLGALQTLGTVFWKPAAREGRPQRSLGKFHLTSDVFDLDRMTVPLKPSPFKVIQSHGPQRPPHKPDLLSCGKESAVPPGSQLPRTPREAGFWDHF